MKKKFIIFLSLCLIISLFSVPLPNNLNLIKNVKADYTTPYIEIWGKQTIYATGDYNDQPCMYPRLTRTANNTLICLFLLQYRQPFDTTRYKKIMIIRSTDNGTTWGNAIRVDTNFTNYEWDGFCIETCPNGDIIAMSGLPDNGDGKIRVWRSTNDGLNWSLDYETTTLGGTNLNYHCPFRLYRYKNDMYLCTWADSSNSANQKHYFLKNSENCTLGNWTVIGSICNGGDGEWSTIPYSDTDWFAEIRSSTCTCTNTNNYKSTDGGATWVNTGEDNPTGSSDDRDPQLDWLDDYTIIYKWEDTYSGDNGLISVSKDTFPPTSWSNLTILTVDTGTTYDKYGQFEPLPQTSYRTNNQLGGWGYLVYSDVISDTKVIRGCWVANNATVGSWDFPPGPDDSGDPTWWNTSSGGNNSSGDNPHFVDINELDNNSQITTGSRWGNVTRYTSSDYNSGSSVFLSVNSYEIQISNNSNFSDVFANITGINNTYTGVFNQNSTHWYFKLDKTIEQYGGGIGTHYYRTRAKIRVRTT